MKLSTAFRTAFLDKPGTSPDFSVFSTSAPFVQALMAEHPTVAALAIVEPSGLLRIRSSPIVQRADDGSVLAVVSNGSNLALAPGISGPTTFQHFFSVAQRRAIPGFAVKGSALPEEFFADTGMPYAPNTFLFALPRALPIGFGKDWVEGSINDPAVLDLFQHEYGLEYGMWLRAIKASLTPTVSKAAALIHKSVVDANQFVTHLSGVAADLNITTGPATVYTSSINEVTHPSEITLLRDRLDHLFEVIQDAAPVTPHAPFSPADFAAALTTRDERKETTKLRDGYLKLQGLFVAGVISFDKASLSSVILPTPTKAHENVNGKTSLDERLDAFKRILDTSNAQRVDGRLYALESCRSMSHHDHQLCRQFLLGNWSPTPVVHLTDKHILVCILQFIPPTSEESSMIQREHDENEIITILNNTSQEKRTRLLAPARIYGIEQIKRMIANFVSASNALWISDAAKESVPIITRAFLLVFDYLHDPDFIEYYARLTRLDRENFAYHLLSRMDRLASRMVRASQDFTTHSAIAADLTDDIPLTQYRRAFTAWADDFADIKRTIDRGIKLELCTALRPVPPSTASTSATSPMTHVSPSSSGFSSSGAPFKKQKPSDEPSVPRKVATTPTVASSVSAASSAWSPSFSLPRPAKYDLNHGKKMGDFVLQDNFSIPFPPTLTSKFCHPFSTFGQACGRSECMKVHLPFGKWTSSDQAAQIAHVEANHPRLAFNKAFVRTLPEDKKHLLVDATAAGTS